MISFEASRVVKENVHPLAMNSSRTLRWSCLMNQQVVWTQIQHSRSWSYSRQNHKREWQYLLQFISPRPSCFSCSTEWSFSQKAFVSTMAHPRMCSSTSANSDWRLTIILIQLTSLASLHPSQRRSSISPSQSSSLPKNQVLFSQPTIFCQKMKELFSVMNVI